MTKERGSYNFMDNTKIMNQVLEFLNQWFAENKQWITDTSDKIWELAEIRFEEFRSMEILVEQFKKHGFTIRTNLVKGLPTAFVAEWSNGDGPVIGTIGEYDALPGLGYEIKPVKTPNGKNGHGCGHNLLGTGSMAAAIGAAKAMEKFGIKGTIRYFGCPAEENGGGKVFMVRDGVFDGLDAIVRWHPINATFVSVSPSLAKTSIHYKFHGKSAHAGVTPHLGRSALDAVLLMDVGVNYLREHILPDVRIHSVITNGGKTPNTVPDEAEIWYYVRAPRKNDVDDVVKRMAKVAEGMAMATETTVEIKEDNGGLAETLPNQTLCDRMLINLNRVGAPVFTDEEKAFARQMNEGLTEEAKAKSLRIYGITDPDIGKLDLYDRICQDQGAGKITPYSTDSGDASWQAPMCQMFAVGQTIGTSNHSWQQTVCAGMSIGHKGMLCAGETLAMTALDIMTDAALLAKAKEEYNAQVKRFPYKNPLPPDLMPGV